MVSPLSENFATQGPRMKATSYLQLTSVGLDLEINS